ncbi:hypothetical protein [Streptomyces decoyicus]|uniref:hypothetical protein n=1 Tax=Streptomyces decoyicus TaxID=249567 RepID=UPI0036616812
MNRVEAIVADTPAARFPAEVTTYILAPLHGSAFPLPQPLNAATERLHLRETDLTYRLSQLHANQVMQTQTPAEWMKNTLALWSDWMRLVDEVAGGIESPQAAPRQLVGDLMPEPMAAARLAAHEAAVDHDGSLSASELRELLDEVKRARREADDQYMEADYWREGYRLATFEEIGAIIAVRDASKAHPWPCRFPHGACRCEGLH